MTQLSGGATNQSSNQEYNQRVAVATQKLMDPDSKLIDFLQYDSALSREQNIEMGKVSSFGDREAITMAQGAKLTQFAP